MSGLVRNLIETGTLIAILMVALMIVGLVALFNIDKVHAWFSQSRK